MTEAAISGRPVEAAFDIAAMPAVILDALPTFLRYGPTPALPRYFSWMLRSCKMGACCLPASQLAEDSC